MGERAKFRVVVLGHRLPNLDPERRVLDPVGGEIVDTHGLGTEEAVAVAVDADAILVGAGVLLDRQRIMRLTRCRCIVRYGVGMDNVDVEAAEERGIAVGNVPDYCVEEVANYAIALLLALHRRLFALEGRVRRGEWGFADLPIPRLSECTLGLIGLGRIGREVCRKAQAFGLRVLACDPLLPAAAIAAAGAEPAALDDVLASADFISLHAPLTPETHHILSAAALSRMKPGAVVINVARGALIDQAALCEAIASGRVAGAGLDVFEREPLAADDPLTALPNTILTPHAAWYSAGARRDLQVRAAQRVVQLLGGPA